jgi:hypothetical protein
MVRFDLGVIDHQVFDDVNMTAALPQCFVFVPISARLFLTGRRSVHRICLSFFSFLFFFVLFVLFVLQVSMMGSG